VTVFYRNIGTTSSKAGNLYYFLSLLESGTGSAGLFAAGGAAPAFAGDGCAFAGTG
jgi:hypothetical protein